MNVQKCNNSKAFTLTSAVERAKKISSFFDDSLEVRKNVASEDKYDESNSVRGRLSLPSTGLNL